MTNINCTSWRPHDGACLHQAAPRRMFWPVQCILIAPSADPRIPAGCALCTPYPKPKEESLDIVHRTYAKPTPPPGQIRRESDARGKRRAP